MHRKLGTIEFSPGFREKIVYPLGALVLYTAVAHTPTAATDYDCAANEYGFVASLATGESVPTIEQYASSQDQFTQGAMGVGFERTAAGWAWLAATPSIRRKKVRNLMMTPQGHATLSALLPTEGVKTDIFTSYSGRTAAEDLRIISDTLEGVRRSKPASPRLTSEERVLYALRGNYTEGHMAGKDFAMSEEDAVTAGLVHVVYKLIKARHNRLLGVKGKDNPKSFYHTAIRVLDTQAPITGNAPRSWSSHIEELVKSHEQMQTLSLAGAAMTQPQEVLQ